MQYKKYIAGYAAEATQSLFIQTSDFILSKTNL